MTIIKAILLAPFVILGIIVSAILDAIGSIVWLCIVLGVCALVVSAIMGVL